jgi:hypothetical protein
MRTMSEITLWIDGPPSIERSHLAETLQDILLHFGYQVAPDPLHGIVTPASQRKAAGEIPLIRIQEVQVRT